MFGGGVRGSWQHKNQPFGNSLKATEALYESPTPTPASSMLGISAIGDTSSICSVLGASFQREARAAGSRASSILPTHEAFPITAQGRPLTQNTFPVCPSHSLFQYPSTLQSFPISQLLGFSATHTFFFLSQGPKKSL